MSADKAPVQGVKDMKKDEILIIAKDKVQKWINNHTIVKEIYIPHKLINIVIKI